MNVFKVILTIVVIISFLSESTLVYAIPGSVEFQPLTINYKPSTDFYIPSYYGEVVHKSSSIPDVIIIGDAHCNYSAQKNIAGILKILLNQYSVGFIGVEGAREIVDVSRFNRFKDEKKKERVLDKFVKGGYVTGPEFLKIVRGQGLPVELYGLESVSLYKANFTSLKECMKKWDEWECVVNKAESAIEGLKLKIYNSTIMEFDEIVKRYQAGEISFTDFTRGIRGRYLGYLGDICFKNLGLLIDCMGLEEKIDFKEAQKEREVLLKRLTEELVKEDIQNITKWSLEYRLGHLSAKEYYGYISQYTDLNETPNLKLYVELINKYDEIDKEVLFSEIEQSIERIYDVLAQTDTEKELIRLDKDLSILDKAVHLRLSAREYQYYKNSMQRDVIRRIGELCSVSLPMGLDLLDVDNFYRYATQRDSVLLENLLMHKGNSRAVLITGGFHTDGITKILEEKGISFAVIRPNITDSSGDNIYFSLLKESIGNENLALTPLVDPENQTTKAINLDELAGEVSEDIIRELEEKAGDREGLLKYLVDNWDKFSESVQRIFIKEFGKELIPLIKREAEETPTDKKTEKVLRETIDRGIIKQPGYVQYAKQIFKKYKSLLGLLGSGLLLFVTFRLIDIIGPILNGFSTQFVLWGELLSATYILAGFSLVSVLSAFLFYFAKDLQYILDPDTEIPKVFSLANIIFFTFLIVGAFWVKNLLGFEFPVILGISSYYITRLIQDIRQNKLNMRGSVFYKPTSISLILSLITFYNSNAISPVIKDSLVSILYFIPCYLNDFLAVPLFVLLTPILLTTIRKLVSVLDMGGRVPEYIIKNIPDSMAKMAELVFGDLKLLFKTTIFWAVVLSFIGEVLGIMSVRDFWDIVVHFVGGLLFIPIIYMHRENETGYLETKEGYPIQVFSLGGNSLLTGEEAEGLGSLNEDDFEKIKAIQKSNIRKALEQLLPHIKNGGIITHGNGPEVGILLQKKLGRIPAQPGDERYLAKIVEETQEWIGGDIQEALVEFGIPEDNIVVVITEVAVDPRDPAFLNHTKPIGVKPRLGPDNRQRVASPKPLKILQLKDIKKFLTKGKIVVCVGGGGIPVSINDGEDLPAVIDKDIATALLVKELHETGPPIRRVVISTAEPYAYLNYGQSNQTPIYKATPSEIKKYIQEGHFTPGKMLPKMRAGLEMIESGAVEEVVITSPEFIDRIGQENIGTVIVREEQPKGMQSCPVNKESPYYSDRIEVNGAVLGNPGEEVRKVREELYKQQPRQVGGTLQITVNGAANDYRVIEYKGKYFVVREGLLNGLGYSEEAFLALLSSALAREKEIGYEFRFESLPSVILIEEMSGSPYLGANCTGDGWVGINRAIYEIKDKRAKGLLFSTLLMHELWHEICPGLEMESFIEKHDGEFISAGILNNSILTPIYFFMAVRRILSIDNKLMHIVERGKVGLVKRLIEDLASPEEDVRADSARNLILLGNKYQPDSGMIFKGPMTNWLERHALLKGGKRDDEDREIRKSGLYTEISSMTVDEIRNEANRFCDERGIRRFQGIERKDILDMAINWFVDAIYDEENPVKGGKVFRVDVEGKRFYDLPIWPVNDSDQLEPSLIKWVWNWERSKLPKGYDKVRKISLRDFCREPIHEGFPKQIEFDFGPEIDIKKNTVGEKTIVVSETDFEKVNRELVKSGIHPAPACRSGVQTIVNVDSHSFVCRSEGNVLSDGSTFEQYKPGEQNGTQIFTFDHHFPDVCLRAHTSTSLAVGYLRSLPKEKLAEVLPGLQDAWFVQSHIDQDNFIAQWIIRNWDVLTDEEIDFLTALAHYSDHFVLPPDEDLGRQVKNLNRVIKASLDNEIGLMQSFDYLFNNFGYFLYLSRYEDIADHPLAIGEYPIFIGDLRDDIKEIEELDRERRLTIDEYGIAMLVSDTEIDNLDFIEYLQGNYGDKVKVAINVYRKYDVEAGLFYNKARLRLLGFPMGLDLNNAYPLLNMREGRDIWYGRWNAGSCSREGKSSLSPEEIRKIVRDCLFSQQSSKDENPTNNAQAFIRDDLVDVDGNRLWREREWTLDELLKMNPDSIIAMDESGEVIFDNAFINKIKEEFGLGEGEIQKVIAGMLGIFKDRKERYLGLPRKRPKVLRGKDYNFRVQNIKLYFVDQSQSVSGDCKDNEVAFINLKAIKELVRRTGIGDLLPVYLGIFLSHEILGHEIGIDNEYLLTRQDVELFFEGIKKLFGRIYPIYDSIHKKVVEVFNPASLFIIELHRMEKFYIITQFCEKLPEEYRKLITVDLIYKMLSNGKLPEDWLRLKDLLNRDNVGIVTSVSTLVEEALEGSGLTDDEKTLLTKAISILSMRDCFAPINRGEAMTEKVRADLNNLGYGPKADEIIEKLMQIKAKERISQVDYNFILALEEFLGYKKGTISTKKHLSQLRGQMTPGVGDLLDIIRLNLAQWKVLEIARDKKYKGVIVQDIKDLGPGVQNWEEGLKRYNVDISGVQMAYLVDGIREEERKALLAKKPPNVILLEEIKGENIVYLANKDRLERYKGRQGIKLVERSNAGPVIELSLCLYLLDSDDIGPFLEKLVNLGFVTREEIKEVVKDGYIKLPRIEKVLEMWNELEEGMSYLDVWA